MLSFEPSTSASASAAPESKLFFLGALAAGAARAGAGVARAGAARAGAARAGAGRATPHPKPGLSFSKPPRPIKISPSISSNSSTTTNNETNTNNTVNNN